jgi:hypothetical protein
MLLRERGPAHHAEMIDEIFAALSLDLEDRVFNSAMISSTATPSSIVQFGLAIG